MKKAKKLPFTNKTYQLPIELQGISVLFFHLRDYENEKNIYFVLLFDSDWGQTKRSGDNR